MVAKTSMEAFYRVREDLPECRLKVYKALKRIEFGTNSMIAQELGWTINRVTPRTNELKKMELIKVSHSSWCPVTKGKAHYLTLTKYQEENNGKNRYMGSIRE